MEEIIQTLQSTTLNIDSESAVEIARMIVIQQYVEMAVMAFIMIPFTLAVVYALVKFIQSELRG